MRTLLLGSLCLGCVVACQEPACRCQDARDPSSVPRAPEPGVPPAAAPAPEPATAPVAAAAPPADPALTAQALPEVVVRNVGLHIGGGPNDEASKAPFQRAIEARFPQLRDCYRKIGEPGKTGVFGVDFSIPREGGRAEVRNPRTGLQGPQFRECVMGVFSSVEFERPARGPTVISYSIEYSLK